MRPLSNCALASCVALALLTSAPAHAQWSSSSTTNTNLSTSTSLTGVPSVFPDHAGGGVFAWSDGNGVHAQRLDAFGYKMWGASGLLVSQTNQEFIMPRAISDDAGGVIACWGEVASGHTGLYAQHVDRGGNTLWGAGGIALNSSSGISGMCSDGAGGAIVVWLQGNALTAQRVTAAGTLAWGATGRTVFSSNDLSQLDFVVPSSGNGAILGWHHYLSVNLVDPDTLFFQRVDGSGNPQWPSTGSPSYVRVITLDDTNVLLSCTGSAGAAYFVTQRADSAYLHLLQPAGTFTSPVVGWPICGPATAKFKVGQTSAMIPDGAGGVVVAWRDESYTIPTARIRAQRLNASGTRLWPTSGGTFVQVCAASNDQSAPTLLRDAYGNYVVAWQDYRNGLNFNLYAQRLDSATGNLLWNANGVVYANATDSQFDTRLAPGNPGNTIAVFDDARTGQEKVYAQFLGPLGVLTPGSTVTFAAADPLPVPRGAAGYATNGGTLYLEGGGAVSGSPVTNTLASYDPATHVWNTLGTGYVARWFGNLVYLPETDRLYALNGHDNVSTYHASVEEIPLAGGAAGTETANPKPREGAGVVALGGKLWVLGGNNDGTGGLMTNVSSYDPQANVWNTGSPASPSTLGLARMGLTAAVYNGSIYCLGGQAATGYTGYAERFDPGVGATPLTPAPLPIAWHSSAVTGGLIWCAGDITTGWNLMSYAPATDTWTVYTTNMWSRRFAALGAIGNTLVVTGGAIGSPSQNNMDTQVADVTALVAATPLASVTLPVSAASKAPESADLVFAARAESSFVTMNFSGVAGAGSATVERYPGPAANVSFSSGTPTQTGATRWLLDQSGIAPFTATLWIQLHGLPDALGAPATIAIYQRPTAGTGAFAPLPTAYDPVTHRVSAAVSSTGEFILGSGGTTDVPAGGDAPPALSLRALGGNPVRGTPALRLTLPEASPARLEVFDVLGRTVWSRTFALGAGTHTVTIDARPVAAGLYFARVTQRGHAAGARLVVTR